MDIGNIVLFFGGIVFIGMGIDMTMYTFLRTRGMFYISLGILLMVWSKWRSKEYI